MYRGIKKKREKFITPELVWEIALKNMRVKHLKVLLKNIKWIISDITEFYPTQEYDVWHDRAVFHFLIENNNIEKYQNLVNANVKKNGYFILATFANNGPDKCSGLPVSKYSEKDQARKFKDCFISLDSFKYKHPTPFGTTQNFIFSVFKKQ